MSEQAEQVYVVRLTERQRDWLLRMVMCDNTVHSYQVPNLIQSARREHPKRREALEELAEVCRAVQSKITWDDAQSQEAFMDALETVCRLCSLEGK